jgi:hypothetical protein
MVLSSLAYSIMRGNLQTVRHLVEECDLNLASSICIERVVPRDNNPEEESSQVIDQSSLYGDSEAVIIKMDPILTVKLALDSQNIEMFKYVLDLLAPFVDGERVEELITTVVNAGKKYPPEYVTAIVESNTFKRWIAEKPSVTVECREQLKTAITIDMDGTVRTNSKQVALLIESRQYRVPESVKAKVL